MKIVSVARLALTAALLSLTAACAGASAPAARHPLAGARIGGDAVCAEGGAEGACVAEAGAEIARLLTRAEDAVILPSTPGAYVEVELDGRVDEVELRVQGSLRYEIVERGPRGDRTVRRGSIIASRARLGDVRRVALPAARALGRPRVLVLRGAELGARARVARLTLLSASAEALARK